MLLSALMLWLLATPPDDEAKALSVDTSARGGDSMASLEESSAPRVELITIGPGDYLYSRWGHVALRVIDPSRGSDSAYNFGGIDLEEGFFLRMMRGYVSAFMFESPFADLLAQYSGEDRTITRWPLELTEGEARLLATRLRALAERGRSRYRYHHFYDNCSTRVLEEIDRALDGRLKTILGARAHGTYRSRVLWPVRNQTLLYVALDLSYSDAVDRPITLWQAGFLGDGLETIARLARLDGRPLVAGEVDVYRSSSIDTDVLWTWPWIKIYVLLLAPLLLVSAWRPRIGAFAFGTTFGLLGVSFLFLWFGTTYDFFDGNWNLLVLPPTHLLLALTAVSGGLWRAPRIARARWIYVALHTILLAALAIAREAGAVGQAIGPALGLALPASAILAHRLRPPPGELAPRSKAAPAPAPGGGQVG